jgi:hypothetical protein
VQCGVNAQSVRAGCRATVDRTRVAYARASGGIRVRRTLLARVLTRHRLVRAGHTHSTRPSVRAAVANVAAAVAQCHAWPGRPDSRVCRTVDAGGGLCRSVDCLVAVVFASLAACLVCLVLGSKVNPGSPLGQPWVPDFWRASVGPRRKLGNGGSRYHFSSTLVRPGSP